MGGMIRLTRFSFDNTENLVALVLALALAWMIGVGIGERVARFILGEPRPLWTVGFGMRIILVVAIILSLLSRHQEMLVYALVLTPPIAILHYAFRPR